jgi:transcriptional regulator with XRE-family HTH domain
VVLDLSRRKNGLYIKALKFGDLEDREVFKSHQYEVRDDAITLLSSRREAAADIGRKLKEERLMAGMSQKELADKVGLTASFVSQLENDQVSPSLGTFMQLCKALGINPGRFLDEGEEAPAPWLIRKNALFSRAPACEEEARLYALDTDAGYSAGVVVLPGGAEINRHFRAGGEPEVLYVLEGTLLVTVSGRRERVVKGDLLSFRDAFPTFWKNEGGDEALVLIVW